jgi:hypothetical protein
LPENEQFESKYLNSKATTVGDYNEDLQATKFSSNSQPYYFFLDAAENKLAKEGYSYNSDVPKFLKHLDAVITEYKKQNP